MMHVVAVRDIKADAWMNPWVTPSIGGATRAFGDEVVKGDGNPLALHPEDYELYVLGTWEPTTGTFGAVDRRRLALGSDFVK